MSKNDCLHSVLTKKAKSLTLYFGGRGGRVGEGRICNGTAKLEWVGRDRIHYYYILQL